MRILILNWRSIKDPLAGGAEIATLEYAKRWIKNHQAKVVWLSAPYTKEVTQEIIDGIEFKYLGHPLERDNTLKMLFLFPIFYLKVFQEYNHHYLGKVDVIIDQSHGFPFLTPLYAKEKVVVYIHEFADVIWDKMFKFPINVIGKFLERNILKFYKNVTTVTGSNSTQDDLAQNIGLLKDKIKVVNYAINLKILEQPLKKFDNFTVLYLNRVVKMKRPDAAIRIFSKIAKKVPNSKLIIIGKYDNDYFMELNQLIHNLNLKDQVEFKGHLGVERIEYLQKAHVLINTSIKEGFGIVNIEANSQGTPVVAFNVEGCRESVKDGVSGYLAETEEEFVQKILQLRETNLEKSAIEFSKQFNYDDKAEEFWRVLNE